RLALLLGRKRIRTTKREAGEAPAAAGAEEWITSFECVNPTCITNNEPALRARMERIGDTGLLRCAYCDQEREAGGVSGGGV
ncbi:MAG: hypothetical protein JSV79_07950, partial [Armatimonadota bacterium]